jgi:hypothetical protein
MRPEAAAMRPVGRNQAGVGMPSESSEAFFRDAESYPEAGCLAARVARAGALKRSAGRVGLLRRSALTPVGATR